MFAADAILELAKLLRRPDADLAAGSFDLAAAAAFIAATAYPETDPDACAANLDRMASAAAARIPSSPTPLQQLNTITDLLFGVIGFAGNSQDYYDPRNSYLNQVLERKLGIPITLSLLCLEVGRRLGVPVQGIGMPGHFLISHRDEPACYVDAFNGGLLLTQEECSALFQQSVGRRQPLEPHHLNPATPREILARILRNLKAIYWEREEFDRCITTINALMAVVPDIPEEQRDRGVVHLKAGNHHASAADFEAYISAAPHAEDAETVRSALQRLRNRKP